LLAEGEQRTVVGVEVAEFLFAEGFTGEQLSEQLQAKAFGFKGNGHSRLLRCPITETTDRRIQPGQVAIKGSAAEQRCITVAGGTVAIAGLIERAIGGVQLGERCRQGAGTDRSLLLQKSFHPFRRTEHRCFAKEQRGLKHRAKALHPLGNKAIGIADVGNRLAQANQRAARTRQGL